MSTDASTNGKEYRSITLTRDSKGHYTIRNGRGGEITTSVGTDAVGPVELLLAGLAACTAADVDFVTSRRSDPDQFEVEAKAEKVRDEGGSHLKDVEVTFRVRFPEGENGDAAREILPKMVKRSHDEFCTVSRTIELGAEVSTRIE